MKLLKDLEYENFLELIKYLELLSNTDDETAKNSFVQEKIHNFFPKLSALQELEFSNIIDTRDVIAFESFKRSYPEMEIDETGKSTPVDKHYWEIKEKAIKSVYEMAEHFLKENSFRDTSLNRIHSQVYNARSLSCLLNRDFGDSTLYSFSKKLFIDKFGNSEYTSSEKINHIEEILLSIGVEPRKFMFPVIEYCKKKNPENFIYFLENLFGRIELLESDNDLRSEESKAFLDNVMKVANKNN